MNSLGRFMARTALRPYLRWRALAAAADWDLSDVNLVAYPKSGVTWVSLVLANILASRGPGGRRVDLLTAADYVPDLHANAQRLLTLEPPRIAKTHEVFTEWNTRVGLKGRGQLYPRVIYLLRDGRDVMASRYVHAAALSGRIVGPDEFCASLVTGGQDWAAHVRGWLVDNQTIDPRSVLVIRYEDARRDPTEVFGRVADFVGIDLQPAVLADAMASSAPERIRALEDRFGDGVKYRVPGYRFTGDGRRAERTDAVDRTLDAYRAAHAQVFEQFGY